METSISASHIARMHIKKKEKKKKKLQSMNIMMIAHTLDDIARINRGELNANYLSYFLSYFAFTAVLDAN